MISFFLQGSPIPAITVTDEHANTLTVTEEQTTQEMERENTENQAQITAEEPEVVKQFFYLITGVRQSIVHVLQFVGVI